MGNLNNKKLMLVVDDDPNVLSSAYEIFYEKYEVVLLNNGAEALTLVKDNKKRPDVILLDINMPGLNGLSVLYEVKNSKIPVIIISVVEDAKVMLQAMNLDAYAYVNKPFDVHELEQIVIKAVTEEENWDTDIDVQVTNGSLLNLLNYLLKISINFLNADSGLLLLEQKDRPDIILPVSRNIASPLECGERRELETRVSKWVFEQENRPYLIKDANVTPWEFGHLPESKYMKSLLCIPFQIRDHIFNALVLCRNTDKDNFNLEDLEWGRLLGYQVAVIIKNARYKKFSERSCFETINVLAAMIEAKDPLTRGHSERVKKYAMLIAREMGLPEKNIKMLCQAAIVHDIGKVDIDDKILNKPGPLTAEEWQEVRKHPLVSIQLLRPIKALREILPIVYSHHEHYDGTGYLNKLRGKDIPLEARILAVADALDAMSSARPYRPALSKEKIIEEIKQGRGTQFDPKIADSVIKLISRGKIEFSSKGPVLINTLRRFDRKLIVMIDDDEDLCLLAKLNLEDFGIFKVVTISDSREGLKVVKQMKPDLVLLDVMMPSLDGFEILGALKKNRETMDIPVVMWTVQNDEASRLRAFYLYADDYIEKPISSDELKNRIEAVLKRKEEVFLFDSVSEEDPFNKTVKVV